jgi:hypothetical protein
MAEVIMFDRDGIKKVLKLKFTPDGVISILRGGGTFDNTKNSIVETDETNIGVSETVSIKRISDDTLQLVLTDRKIMIKGKVPPNLPD